MKEMKDFLPLAVPLLLLAACSGGPAEGPVVEQPAEAEHAAAHWGYGEDDGPALWAELSEEWSLCATGMAQSPIDLGGAMPGDVEELRTDFPPVTLNIVHQEHVLEAVDNGHTIQVNYEGGETLAFDDQTYELLQYHFHSPSEHTVSGEHYPMEMHLVHSDDASGLAVIGVLIEEGDHNEAFDAVWENLPDEVGEAVTVEGVEVDIDSMLPESSSSYRYHGSLTTPPCSEGVRWIVMTEPIEFGADQITAFREIIQGNNRPPQSLNEREILTDQVALPE